MTPYEQIFGKEGALFLDNTKQVVNFLASTTVEYSIMEDAAFHELLRKDMKGAMKVYWEELIGRAHLAAATSMIRSYRWCEGMAACYESNLFLPYSACFRGLVESVTDTYDALNNVTHTLASNLPVINAALGRTADVPSICAELENQLIHFAFAHKPKKGVVVPPTHIAKTVADYIRPIAQPDFPELQELYAELCQFTHPAAHSVHYLLVPTTSNAFTLFGEHEEARIEGYAMRHALIFPRLLMLGFNAPLMVLKVLRHIDAPSFHATIMDKFDLNGIPAWQRISTLLHHGGSSK